MKLLLVHAFYQQLGGEDLCYEAEVEMLRSRGIEVETYTFDNHDVDEWSTVKKATNLFWNRDAYRDIRERIDASRPDAVQVFNTFPGLSAAVFVAAHDAGVPAIAMLSNYRISCTNGLLFRQGSVCEKCLGSRFAWRGAMYGCYRDSRVMSAAVAASNAGHWLGGTWTDKIPAYIALDADGRDRFVEAGLPADRIHVRSNYLDPFPEAGSGDGGFALFAGRLAPGKGLQALWRAWRRHPSLPELRIAGDGPLMDEAKLHAAADPRIVLLGRLAPETLGDIMGDARLLVVPSESHETFGRVALESMARGTPVASSTAGALKNVVPAGVAGAHFTPGDEAGLVKAVKTVLQKDYRTSARVYAQRRFSAEASFETLMDVLATVGVEVTGARRQDAA